MLDLEAKQNVLRVSTCGFCTKLGSKIALFKLNIESWGSWSSWGLSGVGRYLDQESLCFSVSTPLSTPPALLLLFFVIYSGLEVLA